ncbi:MAG: hypothetical protein IJX50_01480 [Clostridia bacterium]|nr:hypothetical protein [Clostridia bacterium]
MKKEEEMLAISAESAQSGDSKEAEKMVADSRLPAGEEGLDAEDTKNKDDGFRALIKGKYKEQFDKAVQKIITKRLKEVKGMKETTEKAARVIERLLAENSYLKKERTRAMHDTEVNSLVGQWKQQAEETKKLYSDFDIKKELENPEFCRLLKLGVGMKTAYEVLNIDSILDKNSKNAEKMVVDSIRLKGNRPIENGSEDAGGIILSSNISKLNKKQRAELAKRAAKGERISF